MIVTMVMIQVKPEYIGKFIEATIINHEASIQEHGNIRFDFLQSADDPSQFLLYEAYTSEESSAAHKKKSHYLKWKETVANWMQKPRESVTYTLVRPVNKKV